MEGHEDISDDEVTVAGGEVYDGRGDDPGTVSEGHVVAVDALQLGGTVSIRRSFRRSHAVVVLGRRLVEKQTKPMKRERLSWIDCIITEFTFDVMSPSAWNTLLPSRSGCCGSPRTRSMT